jgi:hypothetical protein|tara:strand:+ start:1164 stop:2885 length:1722 start_codon:yes stop_codon:yes gene_type:complete
MVTQLTAHDHDGHWLLDFTIEGQRYSYTSAPDAVTVNEADGTARLYVIGLEDVQVSRAADSVAVSIEAQVDWAALAAQGVNLEGGTATLRRWFAGLTINEAVDFGKGLVINVKYGELGEPLAFTVSSALEERTNLLLPLGAKSANSMQAAPYEPYEQTIGAPFAIVIGFPGEWPSGKGGPADGRWPCVPVILTDVIIPGTSLNTAARCVISLQGIDAASVRVRAVNAKVAANSPENLDAIRTPQIGHIPAHDGQVEYMLPVSFFDFTGTLVDGVDLATEMLPTVQETKIEYYAGFKQDTGGGIGNLYGTGTLAGAGDVIVWALRTAAGDLLVDYETLERLAPRLNAYRIDTWVNDPKVTALEYLRSAILPHLPVAETTTAAGWSLSYIDYGANEKDAIATLTAGHDIERASAVQLIANGVANQVTVSYRPLDGSRNYASQVTITPNVFVAGSNTAGDIRHPSYPSKIASASESRYGLKAIDIEVDETWDDATALLIAEDAIKARALPITAISYQALSYEWERTQIGEVYLLTDAGLSLSERVAIVTDVQVGGGQPPVITLILPDPMLKRPTGG